MERLRQQLEDSRAAAERAAAAAAEVKEREGGLLARERSVVEAEALARVKETELAGREERLAKVRSGSGGSAGSCGVCVAASAAPRGCGNCAIHGMACMAHEPVLPGGKFKPLPYQRAPLLLARMAPCSPRQLLRQQTSGSAAWRGSWRPRRLPTARRCAGCRRAWRRSRRRCRRCVCVHVPLGGLAEAAVVALAWLRERQLSLQASC